MTILFDASAPVKSPRPFAAGILPPARPARPFAARAGGRGGGARHRPDRHGGGAGYRPAGRRVRGPAAAGEGPVPGGPPGGPRPAPRPSHHGPHREAPTMATTSK